MLGELGFFCVMKDAMASCEKNDFSNSFSHLIILFYRPVTTVLLDIKVPPQKKSLFSRTKAVDLKDLIDLEGKM